MRTGNVGVVARLVFLALLGLLVAGCPPQKPDSRGVLEFFSR